MQLLVTLQSVHHCKGNKSEKKNYSWVRKIQENHRNWTEITTQNILKS